MSSSSAVHQHISIICSEPFVGSETDLRNFIKTFKTEAVFTCDLVLQSNSPINFERALDSIAPENEQIDFVCIAPSNLIELISGVHKEKPRAHIVLINPNLPTQKAWLNTLIENHEEAPDDVIAHVAQNIAFDVTGNVLPDIYWYFETKPITHAGLMAELNFGTFLPSSVVEKLHAFLIKNPEKPDTTDDSIWLKACLTAVDAQVRKSSQEITDPYSIEEALGQNSLQSGWILCQKKLNLPPFSPWPLVYSEKAIDSDLDNPIDAVITWVDGSDPKHAKKRAEYQTMGSTAIQFDINDTRYQDDGEINYCLQSIFCNAPWIRRVYIVTDNQTPKIMQWIEKSPFKDRVKVVDHTVIFKGYEQYLPTFNTRSIAALLWRIPGLAERYLFMNDDYILTSPTLPQDFFKYDLVVVRGTWNFALFKNFFNQLEFYRAKVAGKEPKAKHSISHLVGARKAGFKIWTLVSRHNPHPMKKSTWQKYSTNKKLDFEKQISHRFRNVNQYCAEALSAHLNFKNGSAERVKDIETINIHANKTTKEFASKLNSNIQHSKKRTFHCLQSIDKASDEVGTLIFANIYRALGAVTVGLGVKEKP